MKEGGGDEEQEQRERESEKTMEIKTFNAPKLTRTALTG
jgi:hypothetical protein